MPTRTLEDIMGCCDADARKCECTSGGILSSRSNSTCHGRAFTPRERGEATSSGSAGVPSTPLTPAEGLAKERHGEGSSTERWVSSPSGLETSSRAAIREERSSHAR